MGSNTHFLQPSPAPLHWPYSSLNPSGFFNHYALCSTKIVVQESQRRAALAAEAAEEEALAAELHQMRTATERDERLRQQLRQQDPELRELERKLRAGWVVPVMTWRVILQQGGGDDCPVGWDGKGARRWMSGEGDDCRRGGG